MVPQRVCVFQLPVIIDLRNPTLKLDIGRYWTNSWCHPSGPWSSVNPGRSSLSYMFWLWPRNSGHFWTGFWKAALETILKKVNLKKCVFWGSWDIKGFHIQWEDYELCLSTLQVPPSHYQLSFCCFFTFTIFIIVITTIHIFFLLSITGTWWQHIFVLCVEPYTKEDLLPKYIIFQSTY